MMHICILFKGSGYNNESIFLFFSSQVTKIEECIEVPTTMEFKVTSVQDAAVAIYDYYEPRKLLSLIISRQNLIQISFLYLLESYVFSNSCLQLRRPIS